jgi:hypothetical protein
MSAESFFVLSRLFDASRPPWKGSAEVETFEAAHAHLLRLGRHRRIDCQVVASSALTPDEIDRYRSDIAKLCDKQSESATVVPIPLDPVAMRLASCDATLKRLEARIKAREQAQAKTLDVAREHFEVGRAEFWEALAQIQEYQEDQPPDPNRRPALRVIQGGAP